MHSLNSLVWRNLTAHKLRSILTLLAISLGVAMVLAASIVGQAANQSASTLSEQGPRVDLEVFSRDGVPFDDVVLDILRASPDVDQISPVLRVEVEGVDPEIVELVLLGVDPEVYQELHEPELVGGTFLAELNTIVLPMAVAIDNGLSVGDTIALQLGERRETLTVSGRLRLEQDFTALDEANVAYVPLAVAQVLRSSPGQIGRVEVVLHPGADPDQVKMDLTAQVDDELVVARAGGTGNNSFAAMTVQIGLALVGIIMLFAAAFVIMNAFAMSVTARTREIGSLRALGMTRRQVMTTVLAEAGLLGLAGASLGVPLGIGLAWGVTWARGILDDVALTVPWWGVAVSVTMGLVVTLIGALQPARRASRVSPLTALRAAAERAIPGWYERRGGRVGGILLFILLPGLTVASFTLEPDFITGFAFLGVGIVGLLLGTVLLMPTLVPLVARLARPILVRRLGTVGWLAADNSARNKLRTALTAGALTIGLTAIIGTSTIITVSLKGGLDAYFGLFHEDGMILPDISALMASGEVTIENSMSIAGIKLDPALVEAIEVLDVGTLLYYRFGPVPAELSPIAGAPGIFVEPEIFLPLGNFDFFQGDAESALEMMQRGRALLLMPIVADKLGVDVGDVIPVETPRQGVVEFTVAGVGGTGTNFTVFSAADGETYFDISEPSWMGIALPDDGRLDVDDMLAQVEATIEPFEDVVVFDMRDSGVGGLVEVVDRLQTMLNALLLLAVVVAGLGVVNTMVINVAERRREIALLRAVGATQRQVRQVVVTEAVTLGLMAALLATALSLAMLGLFVVVYLPNGATSVGMRADWETARISLPPALRTLGITAALSMIFGPLVAGLAAYYPARQAAAMDVVEATRSERLALKTAGTRRPESRRRRKMARSLAWTLAWRSLTQHRLRTMLSALAVALGVAMIVAADVTSSGVSSALQANDNLFAEYFTEVAGVLLSAVGFVILAAAGFLIFNAFAMAVTQRRRQIGALRSLGMTRRQVMRQLQVEALITGGLGTLLGLAAGPLFGYGMLAAVRQFVEIGRGSVSIGSVVLAIVMGLGITVLSVMIPARRATRISPLVALRERASKSTSLQVSKFAKFQVFVGLAIVVTLAMYLIVAPPGEWTGNNPPWEWLMTMLLTLPWLAALMLLLPAFIGVVEHLTFYISRFTSSTVRLMADNLGRDRRRVTLTALTFAVGLTVIVSMNGMLAFMNGVLLVEAAQGPLEQVSWFIYPFDRRSGLAQIQSFGGGAFAISPTVQEDVEQLAAGRAMVSESYMATVSEISSPMPGFPSPILDMDSLTRPGAFTFTEGNWETARPIMKSGCGLLLPSGVAARNGVGISDTFAVTGKDGPVACTVAGIGYGGTAPMSIISVAARDAFVDGPPASLTVWPLEGTDVLAFEAELRTLADRHGDDAWVATPNDEVQAVVETSDQLETMMYSMLVLAIVAAALGMVNTTVMSVAERRRELGLLRAVGATRRQTMVVVAGEAALIGLVGGIVGLVAGAGLTVIFCLAYGGIPFGLVDLDLWRGAWQSVQPALVNGLIGIVIAPVVSAMVAWTSSRSLLRGSAIETMEPGRRLETIRHEPVRRAAVRSLNFLALRNMEQGRTRTILSALAVALGAAMTVAADITSGAILNALSESADAQTFLTGLLDQLDMMLVLVGVGITFAAGFLVFNSFAMSITQRRRQIGALRSLGMVRRQVMRLVMIEALITGGAGTLVGVIVGPLLGRGTIAMMKVFSEGIFVFGETALSTSNLLLAAVMGLGVALLSALIPAWQATRISPLVALREGAAPGIASSPVGRVVAGLLIILSMIVCLIIAPPGEWVTSPMDTILTILFAVLWLGCLAVILPALIGSVGRWMRAPLTHTWGATGRLMADNLGRGRGRVMLTILTLAVALAMIVSTTGFIRFMFFELMMPKIERAAQMGTWMLAPFDYTSGMSAYTDVASLALPPEAIKDVRQVVGERGHVMPVYFVIVPEISFLGTTYFSFVADPQEWRQGGDPLFTFTEGDWEMALPIMESGCGVLIAPVVAGRNGVSIGDTFEVTGADGPVECTVAGIGSPLVGASVIGSAAAESFGTTEPIVAVVWPKPGVERDALAADVNAMLDRYPGFVFNDLEDMTELQTRVMGALPQMFNALLLLAIVAAALGVVNTTMMSVAERRRELGLLRAVGATRQQVNRVVTGEATLMGLIGGAVGLVAGAGIVVIVCVVYGGNGWGIPNLDLWAAAGRSIQPALFNGLVGLIAAPFICAGAAWLPVRSLLRGSAIETLEAERQETVSPRRAAAAIWRWGSIRARFVVGTAVLMTTVLAGLIGVVVTHARTRITEQTHDALRTMVAWNAGMMELSLPENAETLDFDMLATGETFDFDSDALLQFESLVDDMTANGLVDFVIADRDDVILIGLDTRDIGTLAPELETTGEPDIYSEREGGEWLMHATAPIRNVGGSMVGSVRMTADARKIQDFLTKLRNMLGGIGLVIVLIGVGVSWWLASPLAQATRELAARAAGVGRGEYTLFDPPKQHAIIQKIPLRTKLTLAMVVILVVMVGLLELVAIPVERGHIEDTFKDAMIAGIEWIGQAASESFGLDIAELTPGQFTSFEDVLDMTQTLDLARLQEMTDQMRSDDAAFVALVDEDGDIVISDQLSLIGEDVSVPSVAQIEETIWRDEEIWVASTPLRRGQDGELIGALRMGIRRDRVDAFLEESRNLFRLTGLIAVLAGVLLAQAIGGAVTAPVSQLATDTRRVAAGDLDVQFRVDTADRSGRMDELALLAQAYNQMVVGLREREWLRDMFGRFVSHEVAEALRTGQVRLEGENRVVSILFCDIRSFTTRSEQSTPEEMVALLNEYLPVVVNAAQTHEGTVNKFGGDSTLVIYGAPRRLQESAYQAVLTALEMRASMERLNERLAARGEDPIRIGVGINTGMVLAGAVGPEERQEYTVIGDTVNLASRIESLNKEYPEHDPTGTVGILLSGQTYDALGSRRREFEFADLGDVQIRGKVELVRVWAVVGKI
ncbi:MAG: FtsX-like permease family protein [Chloroflexi bacterium]|nr:FtsX-like permease family protein [Chloroflexota bacterium]